MLTFPTPAHGSCSLPLPFAFCRRWLCLGALAFTLPLVLIMMLLPYTAAKHALMKELLPLRRDVAPAAATHAGMPGMAGMIPARAVAIWAAICTRRM